MIKKILYDFDLNLYEIVIVNLNLDIFYLLHERKIKVWVLDKENYENYICKRY